MILIFFARFCLSVHTELAELEASRIVKGIKAGKNIKELVDFESLKNNYPKSLEFINIIENIGSPQIDCYSRVLQELQYNCDAMVEDQKRTLALRFTQCYFNISNRAEAYPFDAPEYEQISRMSSNTYNVYTTLKIHITNLCYFARDTLLNSITSEQLLYLFDCVISSTKSIQTYTKDFDETSAQLQVTVTDINQKLVKGKESLDKILYYIQQFQDNLGEITQFLEKTNSTLRSLSLYIIVLLCTFTIAYYLPETLFIVLILTGILYFGDKKLATKYDWWNQDSKIRKGCQVAYLALCALYPAYIVVTSIMNIVNSFRKPKHRKMYNRTTTKKPFF